MSKEKDIYEKIIDLQKSKNDLEKEIKNLKNELDELVVSEREAEVKIVFIPEWVEDKITYLENRFSVYEVESLNEENNTAKLTEKENFIPKKMEFSDGGQFYRRISKGKISIDLYELQKVYPDIFCEIVSLYPEINQDKVNKKLEKDPEFISILEEVIKMEKPSVTSVVSKSRKSED